MATATSDLSARSTPSSEAPVAAKRTPPAGWWAFIGAACLAFEAYLMVKWVTGPYFNRVDPGPDDPPSWMKVALVSGMVISIVVACLIWWRLIIQPWRRERRITTDGIIAASAFLFVWQDPLSNYFQYCFTYNAWLPNMGSWVHGIPGWMPAGTPEAQVPEPMLFTPFVYVWLFVGTAIGGAWFMRKVRTRWPGIGDIGLVSICLFVMWFVSLAAEGFLMMPLGFYTYSGGHWALFPDSYAKFPIHEGLFAGAWFTGMACLRFYTNDKGQTIGERGVEQLRGGNGRRRDLYRFLGIFGVCNVSILFTYNLPTAIVGAHSTSWPVDLQERSYLTNGICGAGTDRACPGPAIPLTRGDRSGYVTPDGRFKLPEGTTLMDPVPFNGGKGGPYEGGLFGK